jgi:hypothetical protein
VIASPRDEKTFKALRIVRRSEAWPYIQAWLEENLQRVQKSLYDEAEPMKMNRLVGEHSTISTLLCEFENSPENEASFAKANSSSEIDPMV